MMTLAILFVTVFILGFVADPILGLWLDPVGTITDSIIPALDLQRKTLSTLAKLIAGLNIYSKVFSHSVS